MGLVGGVGVVVGEGELHGFDLVVPGGGIDLRVGGGGGVGRHPQRHQRGDALTVRRNLPHLAIAVADADRIDPLGVVGGQVLVAHEATGTGGVGDDGLGHFALVEVAEAPLGQATKPPSVTGAGPHLAGAGRSTCGGEHGGPIGQFVQTLVWEEVEGGVPLPGHDR